MKLNDNPNNESLKELKRLYLSAFPRCERKPFFMINQLKSKGKAEILSIENDSGEFIGLAISVFYKDIVLLDYFAMSKEVRGQGRGSEALKLLLNRYSDKRFLLEIENTEGITDASSEKLRRKSFYLKSGLVKADFNVMLFGVPVATHYQLN
ncbi:MAG: GNAT family N-acetyltransferase [Ruminiclostridium sp.]